MSPTRIDLIGILTDAGVRNLKEHSKEVSGSCPGHRERVGHEDRHASWSINRTSFLHNCFSCGYAGTLTMLLMDLTGEAPEDLEHELTAATLRGRFGPKPDEEEQRPEEDPLTDWALVNLMTEVPQRLLDLRRLQRDAANAYEVRWDATRKFWVLPIRSPSGELMGAQYRQKGNVVTLPEGLEKSVTLFGLSAMKRHDTVAVVESPLDAVRLYGTGIPAVASLGAWISPEQTRLLSRNFSRVVLALDNDAAGIQAARVCQTALKRVGVPALMFRYRGIDVKDVGDVRDDRDIYGAWLRTIRCGL